jgi:hypothetical protein
MQYDADFIADTLQQTAPDIVIHTNLRFGSARLLLREERRIMLNRTLPQYFERLGWQFAQLTDVMFLYCEGNSDTQTQWLDYLHVAAPAGEHCNLYEPRFRVGDTAYSLTEMTGILQRHTAENQTLITNLHLADNLRGLLANREILLNFDPSQYANRLTWGNIDPVTTRYMVCPGDEPAPEMPDEFSQVAQDAESGCAFYATDSQLASTEAESNK